MAEPGHWRPDYMWSTICRMSYGFLPSRQGGLGPSGFYHTKSSDGLGGGQTVPRVLVVDDEESVRRITKRMLLARGFDVMEASSGREALKRLAEHPEIQIAIVDVVMPEMSGLLLAEKLPKVAPRCGVILMTGYTAEQARVGTALTRFPLLMKPFTTNQLIEQVQRVLQSVSH